MDNHQLEVLLVEDNSEDAELSIRALRKGNVSQLKHVVDGAEALDYLFCSGIYARRNFEYKPKVVAKNPIISQI